MNADLIILRAFESAIADAAAGLSIAYGNVKYQPQPRTLHLESAYLPGITTNPTMGDAFSRKPGIFQVTVVAPGGAGSADAFTVAGSIVAAFPRGRTVHNADGVRVIVAGSTSVAKGFTDEPWFRVPVSIYFSADIQSA